MGSLTANTEWFKPWRTIEGEKEASPTVLETEVLIRGVFEKERFLKLLRHYIVFEHDTDSDRLIKIIAGYHQFHAARQAIEATIEASSPAGDKRCGVVCHTPDAPARDSPQRVPSLVRLSVGLVWGAEASPPHARYATTPIQLAAAGKN